MIAWSCWYRDLPAQAQAHAECGVWLWHACVHWGVPEPGGAGVCLQGPLHTHAQPQGNTEPRPSIMLGLQGAKWACKGPNGIARAFQPGLVLRWLRQTAELSQPRPR